jgi:hypothetical protein
MALSYSSGEIQWLNASTVGTIYTVSGLSFQPKALRFYWNGLQNSGSISSFSLSARKGVGFAVSTSSRRAVSSFSDSSTATASTTTCVSDDCIACIITEAGGRIGRLDLNSITSDGFTLIVDATTTDVYASIIWEAWGGSDITVASIGDITEPAATGNVDYTVTGFVSGATDQVVMLAGVQSLEALNTPQNNDSGFYTGFATASSSIVVLGNSDYGSGTMDTDGYALSGECLAMITIAGGNPNARAQLTQFGTNNFRLNWLARATTGRRSVFLAIKGGQWTVGSTTIDSATLNATATISGLTFTPIGLSFISGWKAASSAGTSTAEDIISIGSAISASNRRALSVMDKDNVADSEISLAKSVIAVLKYYEGVSGENAGIDLSSIGFNSFTLTVDDILTGGSSSMWVGYVAFGNLSTDTFLIMF